MKPTTSVTVVTKTVEAIAGSILNRSKITGIAIPEKPAHAILIIIDTPINNESLKS